MINFYQNRKSMQRHEQLAEAFYQVARVNHYMVGICETFSDDELIGAYGVLIDTDNASNNRVRALQLALNLV